MFKPIFLPTKSGPVTDTRRGMRLAGRADTRRSLLEFGHDGGPSHRAERASGLGGDTGNRTPDLLLANSRLNRCLASPGDLRDAAGGMHAQLVLGSVPYFCGVRAIQPASLSGDGPVLSIRARLRALQAPPATKTRPHVRPGLRSCQREVRMRPRRWVFPGRTVHPSRLGRCTTGAWGRCRPIPR